MVIEGVFDGMGNLVKHYCLGIIVMPEWFAPYVGIQALQ